MSGSRADNSGRIDRSKPLTFTFNGKRMRGYRGDTVASALLANGVAVVNRSFKYHRPRGIVAAGADEPNAIMQLGRGARAEPNVRATQVELYEGLEVRSTKGWPSLRFDVSSVFNTFGRVFSAGFYYKTFMRPKRLWHTFESIIRSSAGFGKVPDGDDPDHYEHRNIHCDVLIVGGGPSGLAAALCAAETGARVILADEQSELGGSLLHRDVRVDDDLAQAWLAAAVARLRENDNIRLLSRSTAFGYYDDNFVAVLEKCNDHRPASEARGPRQRLWRVRAREVILAQGAFERPLAFSNNDRPGVMLASAVQSYVNRYGVLPGRRAVVFTNNDSAYEAALAYVAAGGDIAAVVDARPEGGGELARRITATGIPVFNGHLVTSVDGKMQLAAARIARWDGDGTKLVSNSIRVDCDLLLMSGGWSPAVHLHSQAGGRNEWSDEIHAFVPGDTTQRNISAGSCNGAETIADCLQQGHAAAQQALGRCGFDAPEDSDYVTDEAPLDAMLPLWRVPGEKEPERLDKQFLDYQNDTSVADIRLAAREGYESVEHVKRYTALGFGTDQGKLGNINGMAVLAETLGQTIPETGTTTFRPAYTPVTFGAGAGEDVGALYDPVRKTAIHDWHEQQGAPMEVVGQWWRPWYFPHPGEDLHAAVRRECVATRKSLGIMDASTLGKIDVQGKDVVTFLERIYTHDIGQMKIGRCAYGIMLGEDGMVMDDGVMARVGENHFYLTTTTGGAAGVLSWLERWLQTEWPDLDVRMTSLTDQMSTIAVVGPNSRRLLEKLGVETSVASEDFPFMAVRDTILDGRPVQLFRVSFSGELAFEVNIRSNLALDMWRAIMDAGAEFAITPYGTETMHVLRAEKGFVIVGQDTDGSVTPVDLGMNWLLSSDKDFLGKRSLQRADCIRDDRKQLVGLVPVDESSVLPEGTQLIEVASDKIPVPMIGHITSSYDSACLGHPIAMALVMSGRSRKGDIITAARTDGSMVQMRITSPVFYDPKNERQRE